MEGFIPLVEAIFEERAKHSVLLVGAVEEGANVTSPAVIASCKLHGMTLGCHISPHIHSGHATEGTIANCIPGVYGDRRQEKRASHAEISQEEKRQLECDCDWHKRKNVARNNE